MRKLLVATCAVSVVLLALPAANISVADEIFVCEDGRTLTVTNANRERLSQDPCVKAWFAGNTTLKKAKQEAEKQAAEKGPQSMTGLPPEGPVPALPFFFGRR